MIGGLEVEATEVMASAYVWGYPLVAMHRTCAAQGGLQRGLVARDRLATAADRMVVAPNNDTLYASAWFDLCAGDVTLVVQAMDTPERYWSVMLLDAYTHVSYVSRRQHGTGGTTVRLTYDPSARLPASGGGLDVLAIGTPLVWLLARVLVAGPADLGAARQALGRIAAHQPPPVLNAVAAPIRSQSGEGFFPELRAALAVDPPAAWHPPPPSGLDSLLDQLPGAEVLQAAAQQGRERIARSLGADRAGNGWETRSRGADFGDDVAYRAAFARVSLAGHLPSESRSYRRDFDGSIPADLRFPPGGEPPVGAFWSLCVYGPDLYFVDNEIDRYSVGDRTPGLTRGRDGSLTITIGHTPPVDPANWLPAPPGPCVLVLRAYEGRPDVVAARWFPPDLELHR